MQKRLVSLFPLFLVVFGLVLGGTSCKTSNGGDDTLPSYNAISSLQWTIYTTSILGITGTTTFTDLAVDVNGNKWIGTLGRGLIRVDASGNVQGFDTTNSPLPDDNVNAVAVDLDGHCWLGTVNGNLLQFDGNQWDVYNSTNTTLPTTAIWSIGVTAQDEVWTGGEGFLTSFNGRNWFTFTPENSSIPASVIQAIEVDRHGVVWAAPQGMKLLKIDGGNFSQHAPGMNFNSTSGFECISPDNSGNVWAGCSGAMTTIANAGTMLKYNGGAWEEIKPETSGKLLSNNVTAIANDSYDNTWVSVKDSGQLAMFNGSAWYEAAEINAGYPNAYAVDMEFDDQNVLWLLLQPLNGDEAVKGLCEMHIQWQ